MYNDIYSVRIDNLVWWGGRLAQFETGDLDEDGSLTWDEWERMLFHEAPQNPTYAPASEQRGTEKF